MISKITKTLRSTQTEKFLSKEQGQSIVIIAFLMVGMVAMLGLIFDGGNAYLQRRRMQNAADGSSLAGAIKLANPGALTGRGLECAIRYEIEKFAAANGVPGPTPAQNCGTYNTNILANYIDQNGNSVGTYVGLYYGVPTTARGISVTVTTNFSTFFLGVVGIADGAASAPAKASFGSLNSPESMQPLARKCDQPSLTQCGFTPGQVMDIWNGGGPGNFGWLSWNGAQSANYLRDELIPGNPIDYHAPNNHPCPTAPKITPGCWVQGKSGVVASADDNLRNYWQNTGDVMIIPIWDQSEGTGQVNYRVVGFAAFVVTSFDLPTGHGGYINGKFVKWVTAGEICTSNCFDGWVTSVHLRP